MDENIILRAPEVVKNEEAVEDFSEFQAGDAREFEFQQTANVVPIQLDIKLKTGGDENKVGLECQCDLTFNQFYPFNAPNMVLNIKGCDDEQIEEIEAKANEALKSLVTEKREAEENDGFLYNFYESISEILTKYNDTCCGRCAVCLEPFSKKDPP